MPVTQESFRDPRKLYAVEVISPFYIEGREVPKVGDVVQLPRSMAAEVIHSGKARRLEVIPQAKPATQPFQPPAVTAPVAQEQPPISKPPKEK